VYTLEDRGHPEHSKKEIDQRGGDVDGNLAPRQIASLSERRCDGQNGPQSDVFHHGDSQDQPGKTGMQNHQIVKDSRNNRNGRHGCGNAENQDESRLILYWPHQALQR
jgi:hypothetical protein